MWELLTPAQRQKFTQALHQPNSEVAQQLLSSQAVQEDLVDPWWTSDSDDTPFALRPSSGGSRKKRGSRPAVTDVSQVLRQQASLETALRLVYNGAYIRSVFAGAFDACTYRSLSIAYAYVTRRLSASPLSFDNDGSQAAEARRMIANLVPFLVDRNSQLLHDTLSSVITDIFARFEAVRLLPCTVYRV
jgi:hypothetical protein